LAGRLGFAFEDETDAQARRALEAGVTVGAERLRNELERTVRDPMPSRALAQLDRLGALEGLYGLAHPSAELEALDALHDEGRDVPGAAYVLAMLHPLSPAARQRVLERFHWPARRAEALGQLDRLLAGGRATESVLRSLGRAGRALLEVHGAPFRARVRAFEARLGERRLRGQDVIELGLPPGPDVGRVLDAVADARLDDEVNGFWLFAPNSTFVFFVRLCGEASTHSTSQSKRNETDEHDTGDLPPVQHDHVQ
jgi:tRNA nucleotidyltransferase (CCA-adding enzyme)